LKATSPSAAKAALVFLAFAFAYFLSALLRAITATLAPVFSQELGLQSADLGLLAGAYFLGFSVLQLPLGSALDRWGPKRVLLTLLVLAVLGCGAFALADGLPSLFAARVLIGMGVSAGLMAPLTCYRHLLSPTAQLRANSWMLMTGSLGMLASTMPVQALLPLWGWRGIFWALTLMLVVAMAIIAWQVPASAASTAAARANRPGSYRDIARHPDFLRCVPLGFVSYGGLIAVQTLWAGPWLTQVAGESSASAARGLFVINASMLVAFMVWGAVMPRLVARGVSVRSLIVGGLPVSFVLLGFIALWPHPARAWVWALWCVSCTFVSLIQPAVGQAFPPHLAGRALSAYNLVIFAGVFALQWGIGLLIQSLQAQGLSEANAFRAAFGAFALLSFASYAWYVWMPKVEPTAAHNPSRNE
jgi:predicted MFS family arabinose efflux permease